MDVLTCSDSIGHRARVGHDSPLLTTVLLKSARRSLNILNSPHVVMSATVNNLAHKQTSTSESMVPHTLTYGSSNQDSLVPHTLTSESTVPHTLTGDSSHELSSAPRPVTRRLHSILHHSELMDLAQSNSADKLDSNEIKKKKRFVMLLMMSEMIHGMICHENMSYLMVDSYLLS